MADNIAITAGAGTNVATDDVGSVQYQRIKRSYGVDGAAADGTTPYRNLDLGNTGASVKGTAGQIHWWHIANLSAVWLYLKVYSKATAPSSADTPLMTIPIPPNSAGNTPLPAAVFALGIGIRCTTGVADADTTSPATNNCIVDILYV